MSGDRNYSRCVACGALFENPGERFTGCPRHRAGLPRAPLPRQKGGAHRLKTRPLPRKAKHKRRPGEED